MHPILLLVSEKNDVVQVQILWQQFPVSEHPSSWQSSQWSSSETLVEWLVICILWFFESSLFAFGKLNSCASKIEVHTNETIIKILKNLHIVDVKNIKSQHKPSI